MRHKEKLEKERDEDDEEGELHEEGYEKASKSVHIVHKGDKTMF